MNKQNVKPISITVYLKGKNGIPLTGIVKNSDMELSVHEENDGASHYFLREELGCIIQDVPEGQDFSHVKEGKLTGMKMLTKSGMQLGFNGWNVADSAVIPTAKQVYLSEKDDLIILFEDSVYSSYGPAYYPPEAKKAAAPENKPEEKEDVRKEDSEG